VTSLCHRLARRTSLFRPPMLLSIPQAWPEALVALDAVNGSPIAYVGYI
jgi:hypothetical protein